VFVIDSKQWTGSVHQSPDGLAWHNHHPLERTLETVRWEAEAVGRLTVVSAAGRTLKGASARAVGLLAARGLLQLWLYDKAAL
jgi:hypothetical protein